jgi:sterol desaturase/sphingolipid hydroxylase (fatty acid hydroxylase superfamily)
VNIFFQLAIGWLYGHIFEYIAHKHVLHNKKKFKKVFRNHFKTHHNASRKNDMYDESYNRLVSSKFEIVSLLSILILHLPVAFILPYFYGAIIYSVASYYLLHRLSHLNIAWGKKWLPWHYEHHMGKDQHINWGVRLPIIDKILKTSQY